MLTFLFQTIVSWIGSQANIFEKQKVREIATLIRDTERHGKAQITNINEGEETQEMLQVSVLWNKNILLYYLYTVAFFQNCFYLKQNKFIDTMMNCVAILLSNQQVLGAKPELKESTPEEDSQADASNSASLYKVLKIMCEACVYLPNRKNFCSTGRNWLYIRVSSILNSSMHIRISML